jgi:hypothetical protein
LRGRKTSTSGAKKTTEWAKSGGKRRGMAIADIGRIVNIRFTSS